MSKDSILVLITMKIYDMKSTANIRLNFATCGFLNVYGATKPFNNPAAKQRPVKFQVFSSISD